MAEQDRDDLAAGLALGNLDAKERAEAERMSAVDSGFSSDVEAWQTRLAPLAEALPPVEPPAGVWQRIAQALPPVVSATDASIGAVRNELDRLRQSLNFWRYSAISGVAAALLVGVFWFGGLIDLQPSSERYVAMLNTQQGETGFLVTVDAAEEKVLIRSLGATAPTQKAYELWVMKDDGSVPLTLGIIEAGQYVTLAMNKDMPMKDWDRGPKLAVSLEPPEGAPSGRSMGPIVYAGTVIRQTP